MFVSDSMQTVKFMKHHKILLKKMHVYLLHHLTLDSNTLISELCVFIDLVIFSESKTFPEQMTGHSFRSQTVLAALFGLDSLKRTGSQGSFVWELDCSCRAIYF